MQNSNIIYYIITMHMLLKEKCLSNHKVFQGELCLFCGHKQHF